MTQSTKQPAAALGSRSIKRLEASKEATALNRAYMEKMWGDIADGAEFIFGYAPMELLNAMGLYLVLPVQYGSVMAAKQLYGHYQGVFEAHGYARSIAGYETLPLGYLFEPDPARAPYGGLPKPAAVVGGYIQSPAVYELYAREMKAPLFMMDDPYIQPHIAARWWEHEFRDPALVKFSVDEVKRCVRFLESVTSRRYSETRMRDYLARADEMCRLYEEITSMAYDAKRPAPYTVTDAYSEVAIFETHFGHEWALDHVKKMHAEVKEKVANGYAAVPDEQTRLLWTGTPMWYDLGFYNAFEESHGAIFMETMYLPRSKRLIVPDTSDAIAAAFMRRHMRYTGPSPKAAAELVVAQARRFGVDGVVLPKRGATRDASASSFAMAEALRRAGIAAHMVEYSPFGMAADEAAALRQDIAGFIEAIQTGKGLSYRSEVQA